MLIRKNFTNRPTFLRSIHICLFIAWLTNCFLFQAPRHVVVGGANDVDLSSSTETNDSGRGGSVDGEVSRPGSKLFRLRQSFRAKTHTSSHKSLIFLSDALRNIPDILRNRPPPSHAHAQHAVTSHPDNTSADVIRSPPPSYHTFMRQKSQRSKNQTPNHAQFAPAQDSTTAGAHTHKHLPKRVNFVEPEVNHDPLPRLPSPRADGFCSIMV